MLRQILNSVEDIPPELRTLMKDLKETVMARFPESVHTAIAGQFFLRLLCPSITAPHVYGLTKSPPGAQAQRYLILLTKVLQNLANNTLPGNKEAYMQRMNEFIVSNNTAMKDFMDKMVLYSQTVEESDHGIPKNLEEHGLAYMHQYLVYNNKTIDYELDEHAERETKKLLKSTLESLGSPVEINK